MTKPTEPAEEGVLIPFPKPAPAPLAQRPEPGTPEYRRQLKEYSEGPACG